MKNPALALCLLRAGCHGELMPTTFKADVAPLLAHHLSPAEVRKAEKESFDTLRSSGLAERPPRARSRLVLTEAGRQHAAPVLGLKEWPKAPVWKKLVQPVLAARALQISTSDVEKLGKVDFIRREILRQFTGETVQSAASQAQRARAAAAIGATRGDKAELIRRLAQRGAATLELELASRQQLNVDQFASEVLRVARSMKKGRLGRDLVFVNHVWKAFEKAHPDTDLDLPKFKERLREAWAARKMPLAIANVLEPQWQRDVAESRIEHGRYRWDVIDLA